MKCCESNPVIHFLPFTYYLAHSRYPTVATSAPEAAGSWGAPLKGCDSGGSGTSWSEASSPLCYYQPHIKWQKACEGWKENQILTPGTSVDMPSLRFYTYEAFGAGGGRRRIRRDDSCNTNQHRSHTCSDTMSCRTAEIQYTLTHTHTYSHPHKARKKNHEHSRVSNSYKEENGVRAFEDELSCSLSIKLHFLCLFISSFFFFRFKYLTAKNPLPTPPFLSLCPRVACVLFLSLQLRMWRGILPRFLAHFLPEVAHYQQPIN